MKEIIKSKRGVYLLSTIVLILFSLALNIAFGAFINKTTKVVANIKVNNMEYAMTINGSPGTIVTVSPKGTPGYNLTITSLNKLGSKYELIYKVCSDASCTSYIEKPTTLLVEYSSKTIDSIDGTIESDGTKIIRIIVTNTSNEEVYLQFGMNAGYTHNTLDLLGLISTEFSEEDVIIAAYIHGEYTTTFPTTGEYGAEVVCTVNNEPTTATGEARWNGSKWTVDIMNATTSRTYCNVYFGDKTACENCLTNKILDQWGGSEIIEAKGIPDFGTIAGNGLYAASDDYGISYYYRGDKPSLKNNVIFAGFQWKVIRIDGAGNIRMIYNGTESQFNTNGTMNTTGENTQISKSAYNENSSDNRFVGYMYGTSTTTPVLTHANETNSTIKSVLDEWYGNNIVNQGSTITSKIADAIYCNDRSFHSGAGSGTIETKYGSYDRLYTKKTPQLLCINANDKFGVNTGNGKLVYPVGLITADEVSLAGLVCASTTNTTSYLYTNQDYWTLTPYEFSYIYAHVWNVTSSGALNHVSSKMVANPYGVRPVITLNSTVTIQSGDGSATNPFRISG